MRTKNLIYILAIIVLFVGCRTTKKVTESSVATKTQTESVQKTDVKKNTKIYNDKSLVKKTVITETEYFPRSDINKGTDQIKESETTTMPTEKKQAVKSIKTTIIEEGFVDKTKTVTNKIDNSEFKVNAKEETKSDVKIKEKKSVPIKWGWIFGILVVVFGGLFYLNKKFGLIDRIKKLFV